MKLNKKSHVQYFLSCFIFCILSVFYIHAAQAANETIIFLHHSTGEGVYYEGEVPEWIADYNSRQGTSYQISERNYPDSPYPWENYPYDYWNLWINNACDSSNPNIECIDSLTQSYDVIIFKHCFPGAAIEADTGEPDVSSAVKTLENYKAQYRALRDMMDSYSDNLFIVWTLAPLHRLDTNATEAGRAKQFVDWVTSEFLTEDGSSHPNIAVYDFWGIVAEGNPNPSMGQVNCLKYEYEGSHFSSDSHPNYDANQAAGPQFAQTIVDAIENYFGTTGDTEEDNETDTDDDDDDTGDNETGDGGDLDDDDDTDGEEEECAAEELLGSAHPGLSRLRVLRDTVLVKSAAGKKLIALYYKHEGEITAALNNNPLMKALAKKLLETIS